MILSQRQVRDHVFETVTEAEASGRPHEVCYVKETETFYEFKNWLPAIVDHLRILTTARGGFTRWKAVAGKHSKKLCCFPRWWIKGEHVHVPAFAQYVVHRKKKLKLTNGAVVTFGPGAVLYFDRRL